MNRAIAVQLSICIVTMDSRGQQAVMIPLLSLIPLLSVVVPIVQQVNTVMDRFALFCDVLRIGINSLCFGLNVGVQL